MASAVFEHQELFELGTDDTEYRRLTAEHVTVESFRGRELLCVAPEALTLLSAQAFHDINFFLRPAHLRQVAAILDDPEASDNDRMVALTMLKNADVSSAGVLPFCQDTGRRRSSGRKATPSGRNGTRKRWPAASIKPTPKTTCAIRRTRR